MKKLFRTIFVLALALSLSISAFAATTPVGILQDLTKLTPESILQQRQANKTLFDIAKEKGVSKDFNSKMIEWKKEVLKNAVDAKKITQVDADKILKNYKTCIDLGLCNVKDTTDRNAILEKAVKDGKITKAAADELLKTCGVGKGLGLGMGNGKGTGTGCGLGKGSRTGSGCKMGKGNGTGRGNFAGNGGTCPFVQK